MLKHFFFICLLGAVSLQESYAEKAIKTIVIDAGHGGKDPGAVGKLAKEKALTLKIAKKLGALITENMPGVKVVYTREKDVFVDLEERANIANKAKADLFVSVHINSGGGAGVRGTEVYHFPKATVLTQDIATLMADSLAKKNKTGGDADYNYAKRHSQLQKMLKAKDNSDFFHSVKLAHAVDEQFRLKTNRKSRGVRSAKYLVLGLTKMPAILVEVGYITNRNEEKFMASDEGQKVLAAAIYRGVKNFKNLYEGKKEAAPLLAANTPPDKNSPDKSKESNKLPASPAPPKDKAAADKPASTPAKTVGTPPPNKAPKPAAETASYKIQLGVFSKKIDTSKDEKWKKVSKLVIVEKNGKFYYYAGGYKSLQTAQEAVATLRKAGFEGAFLPKE